MTLKVGGIRPYVFDVDDYQKGEKMYKSQHTRRVSCLWPSNRPSFQCLPDDLRVADDRIKFLYVIVLKKDESIIGSYTLSAFFEYLACHAKKITGSISKRVSATAK